MYLVHCVDTARNKKWADYEGVLFMFRVALDASGIAVWQMHNRLVTSYAASTVAAALDSAKRLRFYKCIPFINVSHGKPVTPAQAMRLTGMTLGAAALDFITSRLQDGFDGPGTELSNYVKTPREKKPKPEPEVKAPATPLDKANKRLAFAGAKCDEWLAVIRHARAKHKEWQRKYKARERRVAQLQVVAGVAQSSFS